MKTNQNNVTEMVLILDKSGSMCSLESDTIGGFNSMIKKQKAIEGECFVSTVFFSDSLQTVHDRLPLEQIEELTEADYRPMGCTALYDAIGTTIAHISHIHHYIKKEDVPQKTVFVIITDGMENASREYTHTALKKLIESKKEIGWEFLFIGANIDAAEAAETIGIDRARAAQYRSDSVGTGVVFEALSEPLCACRSSEAIDSDWSASIEKDLHGRN